MRHWSESLAACYLRSRGLRLLQQNYQCRWGEIDLIMEDKTASGSVLVFVEVRYRKTFGTERQKEPCRSQNRNAFSPQRATIFKNTL